MPEMLWYYQNRPNKATQDAAISQYDVLQALLPSSPTLRLTSSTALAPFGRGAVAMPADVVAGPSAVVATLEADVVNGPRPLREKRRGADGRRRCRP